MFLNFHLSPALHLSHGFGKCLLFTFCGLKLATSPLFLVLIGRTDAKAETPILWPPHVKSWLIGKDSDAGRDWGQEEKGITEDEMAGWHHGLDGHEFEWTPGAGDGQGGLACLIHGVAKSWTWLSDWLELNWLNFSLALTLRMFCSQWDTIRFGKLFDASKFNGRILSLEFNFRSIY